MQKYSPCMVNILPVPPALHPHEARKSDEPASIWTVTICCSTFLLHCLWAQRAAQLAFSESLLPGWLIIISDITQVRKTASQSSRVLFLFAVWHPWYSCSKRFSLNTHSAAGSRSWCKSRGEWCFYRWERRYVVLIRPLAISVDLLSLCVPRPSH